MIAAPMTASPLVDRAGRRRTPTQRLPLGGELDLRRFRIQRELARGRCSIVLLAREAATGLPCVLKCTPDADAARAEHGRLAAAADPHVLAVFGHGRSTHGGFVVLEHAAGGSLAAQSGVAWPPAQVARLLQDAARALAAVHAAGLVHRDLKPANLMRRSDGSLALADFGCACMAGEGTMAVDGMGTVTGSPRYAAPEQGLGAPAAPPADLYSLGVVLHEWLTGTPPYPALTPAEALAQHAMAPIPRLPSPLGAWQDLLDRLLAKDPARRPADGGALLRLLPDPFDSTPPVARDPVGTRIST